MLETELTDPLDDERYEDTGRNSSKSSSGYCEGSMQTSGGDAMIPVPWDRNGEFHSELLKNNSNEIEQKYVALYVKGTIEGVLEFTCRLYKTKTTAFNFEVSNFD